MNTKSSVKTTITLQPKTFTRLQNFISRTEFNMSQVIDEGINQVIDHAEADRPKRIWTKIKKMKGVGYADPALKNKSVNDILYGDDGAWRGSER